MFSFKLLNELNKNTIGKVGEKGGRNLKLWKEPDGNVE